MPEVTSKRKKTMTTTSYTREELLAQKADLEQRLAFVNDPRNNSYMLTVQLLDTNYLLGNADA